VNNNMAHIVRKKWNLNLNHISVYLHGQLHFLYWSYLLSVRYGMKTMYQLYPHTSPILIVVAEYDNCICQSHVFL
jgi:hypothetical protein